MDPSSGLSGLLAFVRTADLGSFVAAGRVLGISASAVGKAVTRLEQDVGVRLLQRSTRRIALTEEGRLFHERCRRILEDLDDARTQLSHAAGAPRGRLRVSVPIVTYHLLLPLLPEFLARYPEVELDVDFNDRVVDLIDEGVDLAIRSGDLPDSRMVSLPLRHFRFLICASPDYLARRGEPRRAEDLAEHDGVRFRFPNSGRLLSWPLDGPGGNTVDAPEPRLRRTLVFNNMEAVRGAAIGGLGIGCMPDFLALGPIADGRLRAVLDVDARPAGRFHAVWPTSRHLSPKVRVFVDFLKARLA
ncbi:LysR substrate-binding domain-containing protein [Mitsuaria sp. GD03876]|uniref:LysR substrate-binding domain-containing protein n=1 Tax=Mitsuaria sp. GD03876 TaxID=2975399 RepID=UPI00244D267D|nr:LysR substrate-binding domain-containing protein [Mitsuaria sp. GD03876]MDH0865043.1 LysR substrate-binding domain-containing protein [Mitsuaria sp. GD03876]